MSKNAIAINLKNISKTYQTENETIEVLKDVTINFKYGKFYAVMGHSGCGKSTLIKLLGLLDDKYSGQYTIGNMNVSKLNDNKCSEIRNDKIGFIFQDFNLLDTLTIEENIALILTINKVPEKEIDKKTLEIARKLGIEEILNKYPYQVSGGQKQRCASARAIVNNPKIILADEPTGSLDSKAARQLLEIMEDMNNKMKATILMVTHDPLSASYAKKILFLKDGKIFNKIEKGEKQRKDFYNEILDVLALLGGDARDVR